MADGLERAEARSFPRRAHACGCCKVGLRQGRLKRWPGAGRRRGQAIVEGCDDRDAMQWQLPGRLRATSCSYVRCVTS